jgi:hypothetical protein
MTPSAYRTRAAKKNLREGIKKMEKVMTPAAQVRRDFRLGRPPKASEALPLHRMVVWQRATDALSNLRARMTAAKLNPDDVTAAIVFIERDNPDQPNVLLMDDQQAAFEQLGRDDVIALGMIFRQFDEQTKQQSTFPYQFMGLNERGMDVLKKAATQQVVAAELTKEVN